MYNLYSYRRKRPTGLIITMLLVVAIVASSGYLIYRKLKEPILFEENKVMDETSKSASNTNKPKQQKYNENTDFDLNVFYSCGHNINLVSKVPPSFYGKTIDEIIDENPNYDIYDYTDYLIYANEFYDEQCDNHYMLILKGNKLTSYNKKTPDVTEKEITINLREFFPEDIKILKNGIEVSSKTELLEYFENFAN